MLDGVVFHGDFGFQACRALVPGSRKISGFLGGRQQSQRLVAGGVNLPVKLGNTGLHILILGTGIRNLIFLIAQRFLIPRKRMQPKTDLQRLLLFRVFQKHRGFFTLLLQRADAGLQLRQNIPQAYQIIFRLSELAFGLQLAVAEPGNSGRFLEDFTALRRGFRSDDIIDLSLSYHGIAVPA